MRSSIASIAILARLTLREALRRRLNVLTPDQLVYRPHIISIVARKGETVEQLLHRADQALYQAKHGGRNRTILDKP